MKYYIWFAWIVVLELHELLDSIIIKSDICFKIQFEICFCNKINLKNHEFLKKLNFFCFFLLFDAYASKIYEMTSLDDHSSMKFQYTIVVIILWVLNFFSPKNDNFIKYNILFSNINIFSELILNFIYTILIYIHMIS